MKKELTLRITPQEASDEKFYKPLVARKMNVKPEALTSIRVLRKSIDARQPQVYIQMQVEAYANIKPPEDKKVYFDYSNVENSEEVIVVGAGPAGLFAALRLIELGLKPIVIERGAEVSQRKRDVAKLNRNEGLNPESNYAFGEGGAGTFSDGKLYTRSQKRGDLRKLLEVLHFHGASNDILIDTHPHVGTDKLPAVIKNIRQTIINAGGQVLFNTKVADLIIDDCTVNGVVSSKGEKIFSKAVVLATGHSARDIYYLLNEKSIKLEPKTWAMGVRVEHPQDLIDQIQYHSPDGRGMYLPAASYSFTAQVEDRGVYSFCMCPGGFIVPAMTGEMEMVVNGMSPSRRNSPFANSGMVVEIQTDDIGDFRKYGAIGGIMYQQEVERLCYVNGGSGIIAPAQRLVDFVQGRLSYDLPDCSYVPGVVSSPLHFVLPDNISNRLRTGFKQFGKWANGYLSDDAIVLGTESRTSSPVRIPRDPVTFQHVQIAGLFPCGEGAGYAGGIASSAIDGEKCAEMVSVFLNHI
ncbi:MAG: FAD-binding protein [Marinilabiliaceae bacterium]|nr:FAD-binding protein [Marinilabiliaceae bacterium]